MGSCCPYFIQSLLSQSTRLVQKKGDQMTDIFFVRVENGRIAIHFPFELRLLDVVRSIPERAWNLPSHRGVWSVPMSPWHCAKVIEVLRPYSGFTIDPEIRKCADARQKPMPKPNLLPGGLYPYQREAVGFGY